MNFRSEMDRHTNYKHRFEHLLVFPLFTGAGPWQPMSATSMAKKYHAHPSPLKSPNLQIFRSPISLIWRPPSNHRRC
ncbi:hypothetical protein EUTSA_v10000410mg [Eutrema salsugineum]|uniref:Uncharacterized protein n=1 Tax=Eutrema salsugineum TaxID=72664 RepID=V4LVX1_EUTSA|nr:hypothetical protein EUTSA_v10000410mg [Eutrema salsugineum]